MHAAAWVRLRAPRRASLVAWLLLAAAAPAGAEITGAPVAPSGGAEMNRRLRRGEVPRFQTLPSLGGVTALSGFTAGPSFPAWDFDRNQTEAGTYAIPPDPCGAAGPDRLVNVTNVGIECWTKSGSLLFRDSLKDFFAGTTGKLGTFTFDPKVVYDQHAGRFVVVALEQTDVTDPSPADASRILIAVSKSSTPGAATATHWWTKAIDSRLTIGGIPSWADFPGLAVDEEAVYITANMFHFESYAASYAVRLWIVHKGVVGGLYGGGPTTVTVHDPYIAGGVAVTTTPAHVFGGGGAGAGIGTYLVGYDNLTFGGPGAAEALQVVRVNNPTGAVSFTQEFVVVGDLENVGGVYGFPTLPDAPQSGSATPIEVNSSSILSAVWRGNGLWATATIRPNVAHDPVNAGQATAHWFRLGTAAVVSSASPAGLLTVADQGSIGGEDIAPGAYTFYPAVAVNDAGEMKVAFSASAPDLFAGAYVAGREPADPAGTVRPALTARAGEDTYVRTFGGPRNRWGDYGAVCVDPADTRVFRIFHAYALPRGTAFGGEDGRWGTAWFACAQSCVEVACPPDTAVALGGAPALPFCIVNCGGVREEYAYTLADTSGWCAPQAGSVFVDPGDSVCVVWDCPNPLSGQCSDTTLVTFSVTSAGGEADSCATRVTYGNRPPVAACRNVVAVGDTVLCQAEVAAAAVDDGSFDPEGHGLTLALVPPGPYGEGETPVSLVVTDACGAADTCAATVTVLCPALPPRLVCEPAEIVIATAAALDTVCRTITLRNLGIGDTLVVNAVTGCGSGGFHLDLSGLDSTVAPGDSTTFAVCYTPDDALPDACAILVDTNDTLCTVPVSVAAVTAAPGPGAAGLVLSPVLPNPFRGAARIRFTLPEAGPAGIDVFDARGRRVRSLGGVFGAGTHAVTWDGRTDAGDRAAAGLYFIRLAAGAETRVTRAVLAR